MWDHPLVRELHPGDELAGYRIDAVVGRGGMGVVYRATHLRLNRADALKVIAPQLADEPEFRSRFEREWRVAAQIDHPNVIPVYSAGEEEGLLYIAMRYVDGTDVRAVLLRDGRIEPQRTARIVDAVGAALDAAHERGLVHRDVKPANVLLAHQREREHVYLTDFGLMKLVSSSQGETKTGMFVGTTDYVSPEQVLGRPLDARSDVYSLGCMLFHLLTGRVPYPMDVEPAKLVAHARDPAPSVLAVVPDLPAQFEEVVSRAMAKLPDERYLSAGDLGRAAIAAAEHRPVSRAQTSVARGAAAPTDATAVEPPRATQIETPATPLATPLATPAATPTPREPATVVHAGKPRRSLNPLAALAGLAAVVVAVVVAVVLISGGSSKSSPATSTGTTASRSGQGGSSSRALPALPPPTQTIGDTNSPVTVTSGQSVLITGTVNDSVTVRPGGTLYIKGGEANGNVTTVGAAGVRICNAEVNGTISITGSTGLVVLGDRASHACSGNETNGTVQITRNNAGVIFDNNQCNDNVTITGNSGSLPAPDRGPVEQSGNDCNGTFTVQPS